MSGDKDASRHRSAVDRCVVAATAARQREEESAEVELRACLVEANDEVWRIVQSALPDEIWDRRAGKDRPPREDEVTKLVDVLREAQDEVCGVLAEEDERLDRCLAQAELHTARLIDAHVDFGWPLESALSISLDYARCDQGDDTVEDLHHLHDCAKEHDAEQRFVWAAALLEREDSEYEDLRRAVNYVSGRFNHESRVNLDLCNLMVHAGPKGADEDLERARCWAAAALHIGDLIAVTQDEDEDSDPDPEPEPDPEDPAPKPDPPRPTGGDDEVCYADTGVCIELIHPDPFPEGYHYVSGALGGAANYRRPIALIDLDAVSPDTELARDFTLGEIAHRWKGQYAIVQPHAVASLQELRDAVGSITVNSGYRSPAYNESVDGAQYSRHMYGDAFDLDPNEASLDALEGACVDHGGFLVEYTSHVHCDFRLHDVDPAFFGNP